MINLKLGVLLAIALTFVACSAEPEYDFIDNLLNRVTEDIEQLNQEFVELSEGKEYNFVIIDMEAGNMAIGFNSNLKNHRGKVVPHIKIKNDPFSQFILKSSKKYNIYSLEGSDINAILLQYLSNLSNITQFRIITSESFPLAIAGRVQTTQEMNQRVKSMMQKFKQYLEFDMLAQWAKNGFDTVKENMGELKDKISQQFSNLKNSLGSHFIRLIARSSQS